MNRTILVTLFSSLVALATGSIVTARMRSDARPEVRTIQVETTAATSADPAGAREYDALESRIRQLEMRSAAAVAPASVEAPKPPPPQQSEEEARREAVEKVASRKALVAAEADDPRWSRAATASFRKDFEALGARGRFTVKDIECKTTSCLATLSWGSYSDARRAWRAVLHARTEKNCAREVLVAPPEQSQMDAPYDGTVFLDCTEDRAQ
jgi:hypothetical protein